MKCSLRAAFHKSSSQNAIMPTDICIGSPAVKTLSFGHRYYTYTGNGLFHLRPDDSCNKTIQNELSMHPSLTLDFKLPILGAPFIF